MRILPSIGTSVALALATSLPAQGYDPDQLAARRQQKLQSEFLKKADWITDYDQALAAAKEREQLIFAYFTRSDQPSFLCTALENGPLLDPRFAELGQRAVLFAHVTSGMPGEPRLLVDKGGSTHPAIMILDETGTPLSRHPNTERSFEAFRNRHDNVARWLELKARDEAGDRSVETELFLAELTLDKIPYDEAVARVPRLRDLTLEQREELQRRMINLEFYWKVNSIGGGSSADVYSKLIAMKETGHIPTGEAGRLFWIRLADHARTRKDADLYAETLEGLRKILGDNPRYQRYLSEMEQTLKKLRDGR